jgi:hypothetical protein
MVTIFTVAQCGKDNWSIYSSDGDAAVGAFLISTFQILRKRDPFAIAVVLSLGCRQTTAATCLHF